MVTTGAVVLATAIVAGGGEAAAGTSHPRDVSVVHTWHGDFAGERFGWAVSELTDIDGDHVREAVVGAPFHADAAGVVSGHTDVRSGKTGELIYRFEGRPEDRHGYAMADAGDVNGDGVHDIVVGATGVSALACVDVPRTGRVYVYSGATGATLLTVTGEVAGEGFGVGAARTGDVDGDGRADLVVGSWQYAGAAWSGGRVRVLSGRDGRTLQTFTGRVPGETLGFDAVGAGDADGDGATDYLVTSAWSLVNGLRSGRVYVVAGRLPNGFGRAR